ncbi:MAG: FecR domain-containing protein [Pseudomonadales bacterium]|jgi:hypothetical protein|nr:FecR domain-containing protein [Pseudomonadales bacterium]MDP7357254.1 FecR domain-containing protein [Pseudomonadales bacterium]MDP7596837.1 FecR domain-containing protein [Pseudomonadales bacterium]HJN52802.1 hypothetical protein [Pseudomonadales bacterium]|tara:strand:+ start:1522 stop:2241 length:720 start_codon:yes stop_codon:yes gene_type:complete
MTSISEKDESRRQFLRYLLSAGILATVQGCGTGGVTRSLPKPQELAAGKSIYQFKGDVRVNTQPVTLATLIKAGDVVETFDKSYVIFVVDKDAFILRSNSHMDIPTPTVTAGAFQLNKGKMLSVLASRTIQIKTPSAVIGIRGTGIYVESEPDRSYVCTCYGSADLATADNPGINESIVSEHHDAPRYILADTSLTTRIQPAPFKNHDDQELLLIETLVGRSTPYVVPRSPVRSRTTYF